MNSSPRPPPPARGDEPPASDRQGGARSPLALPQGPPALSRPESRAARGPSRSAADMLARWKPRSREGTVMDFHELRVMTIAQLREVAEGVEGLTGYTQMRKNALLGHICRHLNI